MAPGSRKRRAPADDDDMPTSTQTQSNGQQQTPDSDDTDMDEEMEESGSGSIAQLSKNLIRYALACEYSRIPIKQVDVKTKVLGTHSRLFRQVFDAANAQLMDVFGMRLVELPLREKVTIRQKRAAAASESQSKTSNMWVLQTILPEQYRNSDIIGPGRTPPEEDEDVDAAYIGLYTMIISLILLCGGRLEENKLGRYLTRMNANQITPVDATEKLFARMIKDGYIVKIKENSSGEEVIDYVVGPRGKVEVGNEGVANLVRTIYGDGLEDLEQRLTRSLGVGRDSDGAEDGEQLQGNGDGAATQGGGGRRTGRPRRRAADDD